MSHERAPTPSASSSRSPTASRFVGRVVLIPDDRQWTVSICDLHKAPLSQLPGCACTVDDTIMAHRVEVVAEERYDSPTERTTVPEQAEFGAREEEPQGGEAETSCGCLYPDLCDHAVDRIRRGRETSLVFDTGKESAASLGEHLRQHRQQQGWSLRDVTSRCGVNSGYLSQVERGLVKTVGRDSLGRLAVGYELPEQSLLRFAYALNLEAEQARVRADTVREVVEALRKRGEDKLAADSYWLPGAPADFIRREFGAGEGEDR